MVINVNARQKHIHWVFDTVNHSILIENLNVYDVRGVAEKWVESYLCDKKQFVKIDECSSNLLSVSCGVAQGSVLGHKMFIVYINNICNVSRPLTFVLFVDDTNISYYNGNILNLTRLENCEFDKLYTLFTINKLCTLFTINKLCTLFTVNKLSMNVSKNIY